MRRVMGSLAIAAGLTLAAVGVATPAFANHVVDGGVDCSGWSFDYVDFPSNLNIPINQTLTFGDVTETRVDNTQGTTSGSFSEAFPLQGSGTATLSLAWEVPDEPPHTATFSSGVECAVPPTSTSTTVPPTTTTTSATTPTTAPPPLVTTTTTAPTTTVSTTPVACVSESTGGVCGLPNTGEDDHHVLAYLTGLGVLLVGAGLIIIIRENTPDDEAIQR